MSQFQHHSYKDISDRNSFLGISPEFSSANLYTDGNRSNDELESFLFGSNTYDSTDGCAKIKKVVDKLNVIVSSWANSIEAHRRKVNEGLSSDKMASLRIFGSQRLGVHTPDANIDVLCMCPDFVSRTDFFTSFCQRLSRNSDISMLFPIPDAYTPVIKFYLDGQAIDMIFVSLKCNYIPEHVDLLDNKWLRGLDEKAIRSVNGVRVAEIILKLVPNINTFCTTLRAVKHWARQRGLYSNVLGFLGGVNFAILVAFVCQRYVNALPTTLIQMFFSIFSRWQFPIPVLLNFSNTTDFDQNIISSTWNPLINEKDAKHIMPIITPAFPSMNSAYNVGLPQFRAIKEELTRADRISSIYQQRRQELYQQQRLLSYGTRAAIDFSIEKEEYQTYFDELYAPISLTFFHMYPVYLQVDVISWSAEDHRSWFGWCESRMRGLIIALDQEECIHCSPTANCYHNHKVLAATATFCTDTDSISSSSSEGSSGNISSTSTTRAATVERTSKEKENQASQTTVPPEQHSSNSIRSNNNTNNNIQIKMKYSSSFFFGLIYDECTGSALPDITDITNDFIRRVMNWPHFKNGMTIVVQRHLQSKLPSFVFDAEAAQPSSTTGCTPVKPTAAPSSLPVLSTPSKAKNLFPEGNSSSPPSSSSLSDSLYVSQNGASVGAGSSEGGATNGPADSSAFGVPLTAPHDTHSACTGTLSSHSLDKTSTLKDVSRSTIAGFEASVVADSSSQTPLPLHGFEQKMKMASNK